MATEIFRPMTPSSFKFGIPLSYVDPDIENKYQSIWVPQTPLIDLGTYSDFTNYQMTEFTAGNNAPRAGVYGCDTVKNGSIPFGEYLDWTNKGPFPSGKNGSMIFRFIKIYNGDIDPPGYAVHIEIETNECGNNHRPWVGQSVTNKIKVKTETWVDHEITDTTYRDIEYIHECLSEDFDTTPVYNLPDEPYGYSPGAPGSFTQLIEDVGFLEQSIVDGSGTFEDFYPQQISLATYPLEYSRTSYFAVE